MFVPSCARANPVAITKMPNLSPELAPSKNILSRSSGLGSERSQDCLGGNGLIKFLFLILMISHTFKSRSTQDDDLF